MQPLAVSLKQQGCAAWELRKDRYLELVENHLEMRLLPR